MRVVHYEAALDPDPQPASKSHVTHAGALAWVAQVNEQTMFLTSKQAAAICEFADGMDVVVSRSFAGYTDGSVNVGRSGDHSIVRVDPEGEILLIQDQGRDHTSVRGTRCWCGERHYIPDPADELPIIDVEVIPVVLQT